MRNWRDALSEAMQASTWRVGYCLNFVRTMYGLPGKYPDASTAWHNANKQHRVSSGAQVPRGVPVFWTGGPKGYGHVAISLGSGLCRSTDWPRGYVGTANIDELTNRWGLRFEGWTEDVNGYTVWQRPQISATNGVVDLHRVQPFRRNNDVLEVTRRMRANGISTPVQKFFGPRVKRAYAEWQRKIGFRGADADGRPGVASLTRLGLKVRVRR